MNHLQRFDEAARQRVNESIVEAEKKTLAEILPVVARASGRYERAQDIVGLWGATIVLGLVWFFFQGVSADDSWAGMPEVRIGFWFLFALGLVAFILGVVVADRLPWMRRLFVPAKDLDREAVARAKQVFFDRRLNRTSRGTGVLLFVSLFERRVVVLADEAVADRLSERALGEVRDEILGAIQYEGGDSEKPRGSGSLEAGLTSGIERIANLLGSTLPGVEGRPDEIPSEVVVLD